MRHYVNHFIHLLNTNRRAYQRYHSRFSNEHKVTSLSQKDSPWYTVEVLSNVIKREVLK